MKLNDINININTFSINKNDNKLFKQRIIQGSEHNVEQRYILKGLNDLNYHFLSNLKEFQLVVGEKKSILCINLEGDQVSPDISTIKEFPENYYIVFPIPYRVFEKSNYSCNNVFTIKSKEEKQIEYEYSLNKRSGFYLGQYISELTLTNKLEKCENEFLNIILNDPKILYSTNKDYIYGILNGMTVDNINIKTVCCAYLGLTFKLNEMENNIIFNKDELEEIFSQTTSRDYHLISCIDINFFEIHDNKVMYDFTVEDGENTNFSLPFTPMMKNSDGDILTIMGVFTKQAVQDAMKFSPERKKYFKSLNNGDIKNYIADDAVLGLYNATKNVDE